MISSKAPSEIQPEIRSLSKLSEYEDVVRLQKQAWGFVDIDVVPGNALHAVVKSGGHVLGAYSPDGTLAAFALAFAAFDAVTLKPYLLSHMVAVSPSLQSKSIGYLIKLAQKEDALKRGISIIKWTYDPLISKNANLNIRKLGARIYKFNLNEYGILKSELYGEIPSDRFEVTWDLKQTEPVEFDDRDPQLLIEEAAGTVNISKPQIREELLAVPPPRLRLAIPTDHLELRKSNPALALEWQHVVRKVSLALLSSDGAQGISQGRYCVAGFRLAPGRDYAEYLFVRDGC